MIPKSLKKKLELAGRLSEFESKLQTLCSTGKTQREAKAILLDGEFKQLPSLRSAPRPRKLKDSDDGLESSTGLRKAVLWVFDNMGKTVQESEAPSSSAWAMLQWAREDKKEFYGKYFPRMVPTKAIEQGVDQNDDGKLLKMVGRIKEIALKAVREATGKHEQHPPIQRASVPSPQPPQDRIPEPSAESAT